MGRRKKTYLIVWKILICSCLILDKTIISLKQEFLMLVSGGWPVCVFLHARARVRVCLYVVF